MIDLFKKEVVDSILLQTSKKTVIANEQYPELTYQESELPSEVKRQFDGNFQGEVSGMYNCHGLTFASKRTGVYDDEMINRILKDEYTEIKSQKDILIGDVIIYYQDTSYTGISHSAVVIYVDIDPLNVVPVIRVLSKLRKYKEVVHNVYSSCYGVNFRFFRIKHAAPTFIR